jgi:hypothetical protein
VFYPQLKEHFCKNYNQIFDFVVSKKDTVETHVISIYSMHMSIDYNKLKTKMIETKSLLDSQDSV